MTKLLQQLDQFNKDIKFFEANHSYEHITGSKLISVTTVLKGLQEPFKGKYWSTYKALQASNYKVKSDKSREVKEDYLLVGDKQMTVAEIMSSPIKWVEHPAAIQDEWRYLASVGTTRGTAVHKFIEDLWKGKYLEAVEWGEIIRLEDIPAFDQSLMKMKRQATAFYEDHPNLVPVSLEQILGDIDFGIAGQVDAVFYDLAEDSYIIIDYKTDKKIEYTNGWGRFKDPINHLDNCNYNKYSLQIAMYKFLLELHTDIKIEGSYIVWFNHNNESYEKIQLKNLDDEARKVITAKKRETVLDKNI